MLLQGRDSMNLAMWGLAVLCALVTAIGWKLCMMKLSKATLEAQIDDLLIISDSLNRTHGRRARKILWREKSVGDLVREMRAMDAGEAG